MTVLKKSRTGIAVLLILSILLSFGLMGCDDEGGSTSSTSGTQGNSGNAGVDVSWGSGDANIDNVDDFSVEGTTHIYNITDTEHFLVQDGQSDYVIVIAKDAAERIQTAAKDFANFFLEATDVYLSTVYAEDISWKEDEKFIVLGENAISRKAGLKADASVLGDQGFHIKTVGRSIFVYGTGNESAQFGTYELLTQLFNFDYFGVDCYCIDQGVTEVPLKNYDVTDVPDIGIRATNYQFLMSDKATAQRLRLTNFGDMVIPVGGSTVHNSSKYISQSDYPDKAEWFSTDGKNLCYTAHGNEKEMKEMQQIVASVMIECFKAYPDRVLITMTHEDTQTLCACESCEEMKAHYNGSQAASVIIFLNGVAELVEEYFSSEEGKAYDRDFRILFFAYHATNQPPVNYDDATDTYSAVDDQVILNEHLIPYFAETNADYTRDFYDEESVNAPYADNLEGWAALTKRTYFWMYSTNFSYFLTPYNTFDTTQATYKFAVENKVDFIYDQGQSNQTGSATGWSWLKIYLYSKLTWNVDQDINALIDKFMENYFGPAGDIMKEVFYEWKAYANYQSDVLGYTGSRSIFYNALDTKLWNRQLLSDWTSRMTEALEAVEPVKNVDYTKYNLYVKNISTERLAYNYLLLKLYQPNMTEADIARAKAQFYHDQTLANIGRESERTGTVAALIEQWGIV